MSSSNIRPKWWQLYLSVPLLILLFVLDARLKISARGHQAVQIGILLLIYGLVHLWLKVNASALSRMDRRQYYGTIRVIQAPVSQGSDAQRRPMFSEVKGVLSDTYDYEVAYSDMDAGPVDDVPEVMKREALSERYFGYVPLVDEDE